MSSTRLINIKRNQLYTSNEQSKNEIKKTILFIIVLKGVILPPQSLTQQATLQLSARPTVPTQHHLEVQNI